MTTEQTQATLTAIIGQKLGMTQVFDENAQARPVTVIKAGPVRVVQIKTPEKDGYSAVQIAFGEVKPNRVNKPLQGHYAKAGVTPGRVLLEVRVPDASAFEVGQEFTVADVFQPGQKADVTGTSKGKGFAGVMKRHNFAGQGASHGNHKKHRAPGSIGACSTPARVFKGMRMAGRMGNDRVTTLNLDVVGVDAERGLLLLGGAVPGAKGSYVVVREAVKARG
ncbi:MAG: 50S ribosomal protein L3 [Actinomycetes bacterium]|mgnify:FL=1|jgi:large subunit ribosomal protein L3|nr:50S ribosomal protein L3 [Acidimicrobiia bacterium]